jgi:hypothetical protein
MDPNAVICELVAALRQCCKELEKLIATTHCDGTYKEAFLRGERALRQLEDSGIAI